MDDWPDGLSPRASAPQVVPGRAASVPPPATGLHGGGGSAAASGGVAFDPSLGLSLEQFEARRALKQRAAEVAHER